jgi:hypothetical protein
MRVENGCFRSKEDANGGRYYLHRLSDGSANTAEASPPSRAEAKRADDDTLHSVYSALLDLLKLGDDHRRALHNRGMTNEVIDKGAYRSLPGRGRPQIIHDFRERFGEKLLHVPGFVVKEGRSGRYLTLRGPAGLLIPCRDRNGRIIALKVRRDDEGESGSRFVYVSSAGYGGSGPGAPLHFPVGTPATAERARLIEGELKADIVLSLTGLPTISIPGVTNWKGAIAALVDLGCKTVQLAHDADAQDKPTVARALAACADAICAAGIAVDLERWNGVDGKGLDDLLANGKNAELLTGDAASSAIRLIVASATDEGEPGPTDELARLQDVLNSGGAEALFRDKVLMQALADLSAGDPAGFAAVRASIRERVSVRDLDKALRPFNRRGAPCEGEEAPMYLEDDGRICRNVVTQDGPVLVALCNFTARIVEDLVHDDGVEKRRSLAIEGKHEGGTPLTRVEIAADLFARMEWIVPAWGTGAVMFAGMGIKDHVRTAIQLLSGAVPRRTVYGHTGWRRVDGAWVYLHAGGAIGSGGLIKEIPVVLPEPLAGFDLPNPPSEAPLIDALRASLKILRLGPERITFPILAAIYRSVLGGSDFAIHIAGPTGCFKSEVAALAQQHFGSSLDARHLPANWSSTGNALEALAFAAKDGLLTVDDFCPTGSMNDVHRSHKDADRLFRGQGNQAGRQRMRADTTFRPAKPPRGLTLSTGEDTPRGQSLRARLLVLEISPNDLGPQGPGRNAGLSACQRDAADGLYAKAMAAFIQWLAPQLDSIRNRWRAEITELREKATTDGQHARTPSMVADLALGLRYFLNFVSETGALSDAEKSEHWRRGWMALNDAAASQAATIASAEPATRFLRLLQAALASGLAHVANEHGNEPPEPKSWGWRSIGDGTHRPQGAGIGWLCEGELYLEPDAAFTVVQQFARDQGDSFAISVFTLRRRLKEKALLASTDSARSKLTVRKTLQGRRRDVLHIAQTGTYFGQETGPIGPEVDAHTNNGPKSRASLLAETTHSNGESGHGLVTPGSSGQSPTAVKQEMGQKGRTDSGKSGSGRENQSSINGADWTDWQ